MTMMHANAAPVGLRLVPMVVVLVDAEITVVWPDVALKVRVVCARGVQHDAARLYDFHCFVAIVVLKIQLS